MTRRTWSSGILYLMAMFSLACDTSPMSASQNNDTSVTHYKRGVATPLSGRPADLLKTGLVDLLKSCRYRSKKRVSSSDWDAIRFGSSGLELSLTAPLAVQLDNGASVTVDGIVVSIEKADDDKRTILVRNGNTYYSPFSGCDTVIYASMKDTLP